MRTAPYQFALSMLVLSACHHQHGPSPAGLPETPPSTLESVIGHDRQAVELTREALRIHKAALIIDGHNDLPWKIRDDAGSSFDEMDISLPQERLHTDIPRLRQGGVGAQFWSAFVPTETIRSGGATRYALEQIDLIHRMVRR